MKTSLQCKGLQALGVRDTTVGKLKGNGQSLGLFMILVNGWQDSFQTAYTLKPQVRQTDS